MSVLLKIDEVEVQRQFDDLMLYCTRINKEEDREMIVKAFELAKDAHKDMIRKSGEPYILHPIAVAKIVAHEIGLGARSISAALLHDVVEDTDFSIEEVDSIFGSKIASIIDGLTKISGVFDNGSSLQAENFRKMLLTMSDDVRVILIKLADRLHNMRTLAALPVHKQIKISSETIYLYAPLAHRLGLYAIKTELEDLSLKYRFPNVYNEIAEKINLNEKKRVHFINKFSLPIIEKLEKNGIQFDITGRPKSIYSIWHKMQTKQVPFEEVYDLMAIRIVFDAHDEIPEKTQCWNIYSLITDIYMPKPDRIRDWVSTPKANGYEALHVTVMGPDGKWVEVQVRSKRMDEIAEKGYAAHWRYKQNEAQENELDKWLKKIRDLLENPLSDALEFLDEFKLNLFASEIMVFTPKGALVTMPSNATALDFAYEIHTEVGNKAIGAKVNHKLVGLNHVLKSGDQVEIITSDKKRIQKEWLGFVVTAKAKTSIKNTLKAETKNRIEKGKEKLEEKLKELNLIPSSRVFKKILPGYEVTSKDELYSKIGSGIIQLDDLRKILRKNSKNKWIRYWELQFSKGGSRKKKDDKVNGNIPQGASTVILREDEEAEPNYLIAKCCTPIPGDDVIGVQDESDEFILIHKKNCVKAVKILSSQSEKVVSAKWTTHKILSFLVRINIKGIDRFGMYNNITTVISKELNVNIRTINIHSHDGIFEGYMDLYVHNTKDLNNLIVKLMKIKGVDSVLRMEPGETVE